MPTPQTTSADLLDSIGLNTHLSYTDTGYGNLPLVQDRLNDLGIIHLRDGLHGGPAVNDQTIQALFKPVTALAKQGCDFLMVHSPADNLEPMSGSMWDLYYDRTGMSIIAIEGWNEANNGAPAGWPISDQQWQSTLYASVKAMASPLPVLAPSLAFQSAGQFAADAQSLGTIPCDLGNLHAYSGANPPSNPIPAQISEISPVSGSKPIWVTECGYNTAAIYPNRVSEATAAKFTLRTMLWNLMNGIRRTYLYELLDWKPDPTNSNVSWHWGLVRADGSVKPAYTALRSLLRLLQGGHKAMPEALDYTLTAPGCTSLLLEHDDEEWLLFIWQEVPPTASTVPAVLSVGSGWSLSVYQPYIQEQPLEMTAASTISLQIADHPTAVLIR